jgi:hypothetical protein
MHECIYLSEMLPQIAHGAANDYFLLSAFRSLRVMDMDIPHTAEDYESTDAFKRATETEDDRVSEYTRSVISKLEVRR